VKKMVLSAIATNSDKIFYYFILTFSWKKKRKNKKRKKRRANTKKKKKRVPVRLSQKVIIKSEQGYGGGKHSA